MLDLHRTMTGLMAQGKGILAADESIATMSSRLARAGVAPTVANRKAYREMLITAPGLAAGISGVILCDETIRQRLTDGRSFPQALAAAGMIAGIKVDSGARPLAGCQPETVTEGLDGLRGRLAEYAALGARFAKWRAVFAVADGCPSWQALRANAHALARYAALCQEASIVPIVEPEVLMDGSHSMQECGRATLAALMATITELREFGVRLDAIVIKPNMVVPGRGSGELATPQDVARATLHTLGTVLPKETGGVAFLSGGQSPADATANLAAIRRLPSPWPVTFSFGRALVDPALAAWRGEPDRAPAGQRALLERAAASTAALRTSGRTSGQPVLRAVPAGPATARLATAGSTRAMGRPRAVMEKIPFLRLAASAPRERAWREAQAKAARQARDGVG
jgi:fructose-bisphosphate aldolase class I